MNDSASETVVTQADPYADCGQLAGRPIPRGVERRIALLLVRLGAVLLEIGDERLADVGLEGRDYGILAILTDDGPESQQELAQLMGKAPALVVAAIDRLEESGLVERTRDPNDRRRSHVKMTKAGARALARADAVAERTVGDTLQGLDASELEELARLLAKGAGAPPV